MFLEIMDYNNEKKQIPVDVDNLEDILSIYITILSGDEIATVIYKDGKMKEYDSSDCRCTDFYDDKYCLYSKAENINLIPDFLNRKNSYWRWEW